MNIEMEPFEEFIRLSHESPDKAYDYLCNNYSNFSKSEIVDIAKEFIYAAYDMCDKQTNDKIVKCAAENLADHYDFDLYDIDLEDNDVIEPGRGGRS